MRAIVRNCGAGLGLLLVGWPAALVAQDTTKAVHLTGDIGFVNTAGNTSVTTLSVGEKITAQAGKALFTQTFGLVYGKIDGVTQVNNQALRARIDLPMTARLALYGLAGYERNRFAGIARRFDQGVGLAFTVVQQARNELKLEAGVGMVEEARELSPPSPVSTSDSHAAGRAAAAYKHLFTKLAYFSQSVEYLPNLKTSADYRINSESALVAPVSSHFGLKMSYQIKYNHLPPSVDIKKTDRLFTTGLQITY